MATSWHRGPRGHIRRGPLSRPRSGSGSFPMEPTARHRHDGAMDESEGPDAAATGTSSAPIPGTAGQPRTAWTTSAGCAAAAPTGTSQAWRADSAGTSASTPRWSGWCWRCWRSSGAPGWCSTGRSGCSSPRTAATRAPLGVDEDTRRVLLIVAGRRGRSCSPSATPSAATTAGRSPGIAVVVAACWWPGTARPVAAWRSAHHSCHAGVRRARERRPALRRRTGGSLPGQPGRAARPVLGAGARRHPTRDPDPAGRRRSPPVPAEPATAHRGGLVLAHARADRRRGRGARHLRREPRRGRGPYPALALGITGVMLSSARWSAGRAR